VNADYGRRRQLRPVALLSLLLCLLSFRGHALAQNNSSAPDCATPEIVLQRYVAAVGGQAALNQVQTLVVEAHETEPHTFNPQDSAHYRYQFKLKSPNRVVVKQHQFPFGWTTFIYSGTAWSNFAGRVSHNVKIPFSIYFDFYKATFHFTKVVPNPLLSDGEFVPKQ
jgi:hypothetical protein